LKSQAAKRFEFVYLYFLVFFERGLDMLKWIEAFI
jgi:hypothetical protein